MDFNDGRAEYPETTRTTGRRQHSGLFLGNNDDVRAGLLLFISVSPL